VPHQTLKGRARMRFASTALVMMTIALMLLALMLLGPAAHASFAQEQSRVSASPDRGDA
jgi:hypothetical protein